MRGIKDVQKKPVLKWMEAKIKECDGKDYVVPRIGLRHHAQLIKG
jgi:hypothetical protein